MSNKIIAQLGGSNPHKYFPDLGFAAKELKISVELETISEQTVLGQRVKQLLKEKRLYMAIAVIYDSYNDDPTVVLPILSKKIIQNVIEIVEELKKDV